MSVMKALLRRAFVTLLLGLSAAVLLAGPPGVRAGEAPRKVSVAPDGGLEDLLRGGGARLPKRLQRRRRELLEMGWLEFWEREEALWRRIERLIREAGEVDRRLIPLERRKAEVLGRLRRLYREKRPRSERMDDLTALGDLSRSILPLAADRARTSIEVKGLLEEWMLFQTLAAERVRRESGRAQKKVAKTVVDGFVKAFRRGDLKAVSGLLFRGVRVNDDLDRRAYLRRLEEYFRRVRVDAFEVRDRVLREMNPFTLRVEGSFTLAEVEIVEDKKARPRRRTRRGAVSFTLREIAGRWLIAKMNVPD
ncbi:MAG: hypothetical protein ACE5IM_00430 [Nitrospinota bacterium]